MVEIVALGSALALDATAANAGIGASQPSWRPVLLGAALFGLFQAGMAGLGWWGGVWLLARAAAWDHWVAFVLLAAVGARAIWAALAGSEEEGPREVGLGLLVTLAFATSVDALASGVSLPLLGVAPAVALGAIGGITVALSLVGGAAGRWLGVRVGTPLEVGGGVVLVLIGLKILVEHLIAGV